MKRKKTFNIGELSRLFNVSTDSIRYYEKIGILNPLRNQENNYRVYTLSDIRQLTMIRELLGLDFSTERIKEFDKNDKDGFFSKTYVTYQAGLVVLCSGLILLNIPLAHLLFAKDFFRAWEYSSVLLISLVFNVLKYIELIK